MKYILLAFLFISTQAFSKETRMAVITSEFDSNHSIFALITDDKNMISSLRYVTVLPNGGIAEDVTIPAEQVMQDGTVLEERDGRDVIRLEVENFKLESGGIVKLNYLYSGVTGARHIKRLNLSLLNGRFVLSDQNKTINRMFLRANSTIVLGNVGVKEIQTSYVLEHP